MKSVNGPFLRTYSLRVPGFVRGRLHNVISLAMKPRAGSASWAATSWLVCRSRVKGPCDRSPGRSRESSFAITHLVISVDLEGRPTALVSHAGNPTCCGRRRPGQLLKPKDVVVSGPELALLERRRTQYVLARVLPALASSPGPVCARRLGTAGRYPHSGSAGLHLVNPGQVLPGQPSKHRPLADADPAAAGNGPAAAVRRPAERLAFSEIPLNFMS